MARVILLEASPRTSAGVATTVRLAGGGSQPYLGHRGADDWRSGIVAMPRFTTEIGFAAGEWTGGAVPATGAVEFMTTDMAFMAELASHYWNDARIRIWTCDDEVAPVYRPELVGTVAGHGYAGGRLTLTIADLSGDLARPFTSGTFTGAGGLEGGSDAAGRTKRRSLGAVYNIAGQLLDQANNIWEFGDPARPIKQFRMVKDKGAAALAVTVVGWAGSAQATLDALRAASAPAGGCAAAPSICCVKWYRQPAGPLTADLLGEIGPGYVDRVATIAERIAAGAAIGISNVADILTLTPGEAGIHCGSTGDTLASLLDRLLLPLDLPWVLQPAGVIDICPFGWDNPVEEVTSHEAQREVTFAPPAERRVGYRRNHRQHSDSEISASASDVAWDDIADPNGTKPADNATNTRDPAAPMGPDKTVSDVLQDAARLITEVDRIVDLIENTDLGDSGATKAAKEAAEAARDAAITARDNALAAQGLAQTARDAAGTARGAAETAATAAAQSKTDAGNHATTASGQATIATQEAGKSGASAVLAKADADRASTKAGEATSSASRALTSEQTADGYRIAAQTAQEITAGTYKATVLVGGNQFFDDGTTGWMQRPTGGALSVTHDFLTALDGKTNIVRSKGKVDAQIYSEKLFDVDPTRKYRFRTVAWTGPGTGSAVNYYGFQCLDGNGTIGSNTGHEYWKSGSQAAGSGWVEHVSPVITGAAFRPGTTRVRLLTLQNYSSYAEVLTAVDRMTIEDVTAQENAAASAQASAGSATAAGTSATAAGTSAGAAQTDRVAAQTARSEAEGFRDQAATSSSNAAGSASTASTQAGLATTARNTADQRATAATGAAEVATAKADAAGVSATVAGQHRADAQAFSVQSSTSAGLAQGYAAFAGEKAAAAQASAVLSAAYNRPRPNLVSNGSGEQGMAGMSGSLNGFYTPPSTFIWGSCFLSADGSVPTGALEWPRFEVQAGEYYTVSADTALFAAGGAVYVDILFLNGAGDIVLDGPNRSRPATHDFSSDQSGKDAVVVTVQAPAGSVHGIARFVWENVTGLQTRGVRQMKVERGAAGWTGYDQPLAPAFALIGSKASITQLNEVVASQNEARATVKSSLEASIGGVSGRVDQHAGALATLDGRTSVHFSVAAVSSGGVATLSLVSDSMIGTVFRLTAGTIILDGNVIATGTVTSREIGRGAVTSFLAFANSNRYRGDNAGGSGSSGGGGGAGGGFGGGGGGTAIP